MPTSLTATKIKDTYGQVLHVDGGVTSTPKLVYDGDGTATALKVSTTDVQVNNSPVLTDADIGSTVQAYDADLTAWSGKTAPTGAVVGTTDTQTLSSKTFSDNPTFNGGTAYGVAYLNGSKVLTTGSALTYNGQALSVGDGTVTMQVYPYASGSVGYFGTSSNHPLAFPINGSEQMRLTSTGLGIGTSSPNNKLTLATTAFFSNSNVYIQDVNYLESGVLYPVLKLGYVASGGGIRSGLIDSAGYSLALATGGTTKAIIDSSGNLGLGVTPSAWTTFTAMQIKNAAYAGYGNGLYMTANAYYNSGSGAYLRIAADYASSYYQEDGKHVWSTAASSTAGSAISFTRAMTLDASGNLGIGTSSPAFSLETVSGVGLSTSGTGVIATFGANNTNDKYVRIRNSSGHFEIGTISTAHYLYGNGSIPLVFYTNATERMRIDSSGNLIIGDTVANQKLQITGAGPVGIRIRDVNTNNWDIVNNSYLAFIRGSTENMRIDSNGNLLVGTTTLGDAGWSIYGATSLGGAISKTSSTVTFTHLEIKNGNGTVGSIQSSGFSTAYNTSSDYRLKENIQPMQNALAVVQQLNPVTYTWKADGSDGQGFIAHELQAVVPDCVTGEKDAVDADGKPVYQGIDTSFLVATLTAAIKELKAELDATKAEVASLKGV